MSILPGCITKYNLQEDEQVELHLVFSFEKEACIVFSSVIITCYKAKRHDHKICHASCFLGCFELSRVICMLMAQFANTNDHLRFHP